ncbi:MAG: peptidylprolyl isomerase, partial [Bacteroidota bacterium]
MRYLFILLLFLGLCTSCIPPEPPEYAGVVVDLNDPSTRRMYDLQNDRQADSLVRYLSHESASIRYLAARGLGSFPEVEASTLDRLVAVLRDRDPDVRTAAAYALGQLGEGRIADSLGLAFDTLGRAREYNAAVLAAVGKIGTERHHDQVAAITTYRNTDTLLTAAQAWSLFYFARRDITSPTGDRRILSLLLDATAATKIRKPAAYYLQRFSVAVDTAQASELRRLLRTEKDPDIRMGIVRTLGRGKSAAGRVALIRALRSAQDWRVRTETIRALSNYDYVSVREPIVERLKDSHPLVRQTAAAFLLNNGTATDATFYRQLARDSTQTDIRYTLYAAANRHLPLSFADYRGRINYDLQQAYAKTTDIYSRRSILAALGEFPWNYRTIYELYQQSDQAAVRTAAAEALQAISQRDDFATFFRASTRRVRLDLSTYFREMITSLEVGPSYAAAGALVANAAEYRVFLPEPDWLAISLRGFDLPKEIEAYRAVANAQAALLQLPEPEPHQAEAKAKAIDWDIIEESGSQAIVLRTNAGRIVLKLWPDLAPETVSSFLELVGSKYYHGKVFHRVVPNFVAQGGGPLGDGFGGEDFALRTETPGPRWDRPGLIGMASAGKDTEGVQFFITHRPTPHLDGNYTIFG